MEVTAAAKTRNDYHLCLITKNLICMDREKASCINVMEEGNRKHL